MCKCKNCECNLESKIANIESKLNDLDEEKISNYTLAYPFFNIKCICCDKLYIESTDYKYPLATGSIQHTSWYHKYVKGKSIWVCRSCNSHDLEKYIKKLGD